MLLLVEHEWPDCQFQSQSEGSACKCEYMRSCCGRLILSSDTFETHVRSAAQGLSTEMDGTGRSNEIVRGLGP